jgi:hypothetical protein
LQKSKFEAKLRQAEVSSIHSFIHSEFSF